MENSDFTDNSFYKIQFEALRAEILGIKERVIKLQLIGITGIPLLFGTGEKYDLSAVLIVSPLITIAFAFMLVFEQGSLMRSGEYIKDNLEKYLCKGELIGWENWLQTKPERRKSETFFAWSAHIIFAIYFAIGTWLAFNSLESKFGFTSALIAISFYCGGFLLALYLVITNFRIGTGTPIQIAQNSRN